MEGLIEIAMKKLGEGSKEECKKEEPLTKKAAKLAMDALKKDDVEAFEKALNSYWRIKQATHEDDEE
jgi:galactokinase/mevalonate kinase-like predicted kinase